MNQTAIRNAAISLGASLVVPSEFLGGVYEKLGLLNTKSELEATLKKYTIPQLKQIARAHRITKSFTGWRKADYIERISQLLSACFRAMDDHNIHTHYNGAELVYMKRTQGVTPGEIRQFPTYVNDSNKYCYILPDGTKETPNPDAREDETAEVETKKVEPTPKEYEFNDLTKIFKTVDGLVPFKFLRDTPEYDEFERKARSKMNSMEYWLACILSDVVNNKPEAKLLRIKSETVKILKEFAGIVLKTPEKMPKKKADLSEIIFAVYRKYEEYLSAKSNAGSKIARVRTIRGTEADVQYRVVEAEDLIVSTLENGTPNPEYPQDLQPRQRNREGSRQQVNNMANNLVPELLGENPLASDGAPIIGSDLVVESGNGRVMAIKQAYKRGKAKAYRTWLKKNAEKFGINPKRIAKMKNPVLVRERISEVDRVKFTSEANESSTAQMSASENAFNDAKKMTNAMLAEYDIEKPLAANTSFMQSFLELISGNERGNLLQSDGRISRSGFERVQNALTAKAYNDTSIINRLSEIFDDDIKSVSSALIQAAPKIAILQNSGIRPEHAISSDIMQASNILVNLRQSGQSVGEYLGTLSMFDDVTPEAQKLLKFFDENKRSSKRIAQGLINYAESAMNEAKQGQAVLFEDSIRTKGQILDEAIKVEPQILIFGGTLQPKPRVKSQRRRIKVCC